MPSSILHPPSSLAFVALGSNLGDSRRIILETLERLQACSDVPILKSSLWQTSPVDCPVGSPLFVNAAAGLTLRKGETPESLLLKLRALEKEFGRLPKIIPNEPRPLDLDLIAFSQEIRHSLELTLPHPRTHLRKFVLRPLNEIAPGLVLPHQKKTVSQLLAELISSENLVRLE